MATRKITFNANPIQKRFIESRAMADLFSSRMGEGKSAALAWAIFYHTRMNPGAQWALIRDTWENLQATTMKEFFKWFPPGVFGDYNASQKRFVWTIDEMGGGDVSFLGMDDQGDATKLQSRELAGFAMDEPAPAAESGGIDEMIFTIAMTRLRQPGMNWYAAKLAENNPDETHWTYKRFVSPGREGFRIWQPDSPENMLHLPENYYEEMRETLAHRPDLVRRFVEGTFGYQQMGKKVTPEWNDAVHLAVGLRPIKGRDLVLLWDFGHNPTCLVTQVTPLGTWLILEAVVGDDMGVEELITAAVKPLLAERYAGFRWRHIGDPSGVQREQTSILRSAVKEIKKQLGGKWRSGPPKTYQRVDPLRAVLRQNKDGAGLMRVDRHRAEAVWHALRGGWHYHVSKQGIISREAEKNIHSHPGDSLGYGAAVLFPLGRMMKRKTHVAPKSASHFEGTGLGFEHKGLILPTEARSIG